jgi:hypothetical protein
MLGGFREEAALFIHKKRKNDILVESSLLTGIMELLYEKYAVEIKDV